MQLRVLQTFLVELLPGQSLPPLAGEGLLQDLYLIMYPPSHSAEQEPYDPQDDQEPCTGPDGN